MEFRRVLFRSVQDFNNDQITDLATANSSDKNVSVLLGTGDGTLGTANTFKVGAGEEARAGADFDGDGNADRVVTDENKSVYISSGNGDGPFAPPTTISLAPQP